MLLPVRFLRTSWQSNDLKTLLFRNLGKQLVRLKLYALQNVVANDNDDLPSRPHTGSRESAKELTIVKVGCGVVRPPAPAIGTFLLVTRPEVLELFG